MDAFARSPHIRQEKRSRGHERDEAILRAYASGGYSLKEIGIHFDLHYSRVSRIVNKRRLAIDKS